MHLNKISCGRVIAIDTSIQSIFIDNVYNNRYEKTKYFIIVSSDILYYTGDSPIMFTPFFRKQWIFEFFCTTWVVFCGVTNRFSKFWCIKFKFVSSVEEWPCSWPCRVESLVRIRIVQKTITNLSPRFRSDCFPLPRPLTPRWRPHMWKISS